jgi:HK97 family phage major capsid protein
MDEKMLEKLDEISVAIEKRLQDGEKVSKDAEGRVVALEDQLKAVTEKHAELEKSIADRAWANVPGVNEGKDKDRFSLIKTINAITSKTWEGAGYEKEVIDAAMQKNQNARNDTAGGYLIPTQAIQDVIEILRNNLVVQTLGATVMDGLTGIPVEIPKQTSKSSTFWIDEDATITDSQIGLGQLSLNPKGLASMVKLSNRLLALSQPSAEALVRNDMAMQMAEALDLAALRGTGVAGQPMGVANTPGISTVDFSTATATSGYVTNPGWEQLFDMEGKLADLNALRGNVGFAFHPSFKRNIAKVRADGATADNGQGDFILNPATDARIAQLLGYPFATTTQIPTNLGAGSDETEVYMANWSDLIIANWVGMTLLASQEAGTAFATNQTWVRMITDVDVAVRRPESFCLGTVVKNKITTVA